MGVGERETLEQNVAIPSDRENGNGNLARRPKKERGGSRDRSLRELLAGLRAVDAGDFSVTLTPNGDPAMADIIDAFNSVTRKQARLVDELSRVSGSVGREGKMRDRVSMSTAGGAWVTAVESVNSLISGLVAPTSEVSRVIKAVAEGDLSQKVELEIEG